MPPKRAVTATMKALEGACKIEDMSKDVTRTKYNTTRVCLDRLCGDGKGNFCVLSFRRHLKSSHDCQGLTKVLEQIVSNVKPGTGTVTVETLTFDNVRDYVNEFKSNDGFREWTEEFMDCLNVEIFAINNHVFPQDTRPSKKFAMPKGTSQSDQKTEKPEKPEKSHESSIAQSTQSRNSSSQKIAPAVQPTASAFTAESMLRTIFELNEKMTKENFETIQVQIKAFALLMQPQSS
jgi:hypothetical protein